MKTPFLDAMGEAMALVKNANLGDAAAVVRRTLSGGAPATGRTPTNGSSVRPGLGEVLRALRAGRTAMPKAPFAPAESPACPPDEKFASRSYRGPEGPLNYRLYVPADHAAHELALVLMLHGCTQNPEDFAVGTRMNALADEFGLIVAYPHQPKTANASGCWNWFDRRHQHRGCGEPARLAGLARSLADEFRITRERTFAAGLSAGGAMAEILAATYADVFDAVGIHSGLPYKAAKDVPSAFAAMKGAAVAEPALRVVSEVECRKIVFHGGADATVHPVNAERILEQARDRGSQTIETETEVEGRRVDRMVLQDRAGDPIVESWFVQGGQHAWFGGDARGTYTQSVGLDASRLMVRFFLRQ